MSAKRSVLQSKHDKNGALIGMVLGDSAVRMTGERNAYISTCHKIENRDYLEWKRDLLRAYCDGDIVEYQNGNYQAVRWYIPTNHRQKFLYDDFYSTGKKAVTRNILNRLTDLGLAIWFMDDGCLTLQRDKATGRIKARPFTIATDCFGYSGNLIIQRWFNDKYGINVKVHKSKSSWKIWGSTSETHKLLAVIKPYIDQVPSMRYKADMCYQSVDVTVS